MSHDPGTTIKRYDCISLKSKLALYKIEGRKADNFESSTTQFVVQYNIS